jgi:lambda family phage portal protein
MIDRLLAYLSPRVALSRHVDRIRLQRAYEAASPRDSWRPRRAGASPAADHQADAAILRAKARALTQNVPYVAAGLEALVCNTIGSGITTYATGSDGAKRNATWARWGKVCDADGRLDWAGMQAAAYRAMEQDGEVLIRLRPRLASDGLPVPLQLQLLEVDWIDTARTTGAAAGNSLVNGIEYDRLGRVVAYWLWSDHPGNSGVYLRTGARRESQRVPASSIIHLFAPERPGQGRGITRLASIIPRVRDLQLYEDAELARKNLEARLSVLVSGDVSGLANPPQWGGQVDQAAQQTGELGELRSGAITSLPPGMHVTTVAPTPVPGYVDSVKHHLHVIAVGMGVTYEQLTGDMREVNFSSARVRQADFRRQVEARQWLCIIPRLIEPVYRAFIDAGVLVGLWRTDYACDHSTPKWDYVNPQQDAESELKLISSGLLTISESLRRRGYKPDDVFAELQSDFARLRELGVLDVLMLLQKGRTEAGEPAPAPAAAQDDGGARAAAVLRAPMEAISRAVEAISARPPANPTRMVIEGPLATIAPPPVEVRVEAPSVNVQPTPVEVRVEAPSVHVHPTPVEVRVEAPEVTVAAPDVTVHNSLRLPARRTESTIERDSAGRVARTVQVERDADE